MLQSDTVIQQAPLRRKGGFLGIMKTAKFWQYLQMVYSQVRIYHRKWDPKFHGNFKRKGLTKSRKPGLVSVNKKNYTCKIVDFAVEKSCSVAENMLYPTIFCYRLLLPRKWKENIFERISNEYDQWEKIVLSCWKLALSKFVK